MPKPTQGSIIQWLLWRLNPLWPIWLGWHWRIYSTRTWSRREDSVTSSTASNLLFQNSTPPVTNCWPSINCTLTDVQHATETNTRAFNAKCPSKFRGPCSGIFHSLFQKEVVYNLLSVIWPFVVSIRVCKPCVIIYLERRDVHPGLF
jgi:hypothetical protein